MNSTETMRHLAAIGSGTPLTVFVWVLTAGHGVTQGWLESMTGYSDKTIAPALERLASLEYIIKASGGWQIAPGRQGVLGEVLAGLPSAGEPQTTGTPTLADLDHRVGISVSDGNSDSDDAGIIIVNESTKSVDSLKQQKHPQDESRKFRLPRKDRHIKQVLDALARKGLPRLDVDDPFPADLRICIERLVTVVHVPRKRAELAISSSPWPATKILEQVDIWLAYRASKAGANMQPFMFANTVAARISAGEECPQDARQVESDDRYGGYLDPDGETPNS